MEVEQELKVIHVSMKEDYRWIMKQLPIAIALVTTAGKNLSQRKSLNSISKYTHQSFTRPICERNLILSGI